MICKSKINAHINYLSDHVAEFPYGGPVNFLYFIFKKQYLRNQVTIDVSKKELEYEDLILKDTILSLDMDLLDIIKTLPNYKNGVFTIEKIDSIVSTGQDLIIFLESNSRKIL